MLSQTLADAQAAVMALQQDAAYQARIAEESAIARRELDAATRRRWRSSVSRVAPVRAARVAWDHRDTPATRAVLEWLEDTSEHLVLRGGIGCGKSTAACLAVKHWCKPEIEALSAGDELREPDVSWFTPDALVSAVMHAYDESAPKLRRHVVVDDMGRERSANEFGEALCRLLDLAEHTLLITTNLTRDEMRARYDMRLIDRLCDTAEAVDLPAQSLRRQNPKF
jgi:hypothetical protein